jgi:tRNA threonylcarbamoyladenosine biosynthesis protein TsaE
MQFEARNEEEMIETGRRIAALLPARAVVILTGDLGAGKTTLVKGIAAARAGVSEEEISSPTFALIHEYGQPVAVYHVDLYRLDTEAEVFGLGLEEIFDRNALVLIEWGERFERLIPFTHRIRIENWHEGRQIELS